MNLLFVLCCLPAAEPADPALELLRTFRNEFIVITPGQGRFPASYLMGGTADGPSAERPPHRVTLQRSFAIARHEVPQDLWQAVMGNNPSRWQGSRNAVDQVSYDDAVLFCRRVTERLREAGLIRPPQVVRLPSEAEWEYAARAGTAEAYSFGGSPRSLGDHAWYAGNAAGNDPPVGAKLPNPWGLYDIHGYLWEWCLDQWHHDYENAPPDGRAWIDDGDDAHHVLRGGSWKDPAERLTSSYRRRAVRNLRDDAVGVRCVLSQGPNGF